MSVVIEVDERAMRAASLIQETQIDWRRIALGESVAPESFTQADPVKVRQLTMLIAIPEYSCRKKQIADRLPLWVRPGQYGNYDV